MKASLSCDDLFNLQDLQEFEPKSPYVPDLAPDDGRVSLRQELIMPQILAASPPKAPPPAAAKPATNADFTAYQLFVRGVLVRYPCGSADVRPQLLESRRLFGKKDKDLLATFHGFFEASLHDYEAKGDEARPPAPAPCPAKRCKVKDEADVSARDACPRPATPARRAARTSRPADSTAWYKGSKKGQECAWVGEKPLKRCEAKSKAKVFARDACPVACDTCPGGRRAGRRRTSTAWYKGSKKGQECACEAVGPATARTSSASCVCFRGALDYAAVVLTRFDDCAFVTGNYAVVDGGDGDDVVILGGGRAACTASPAARGDDAITLLQSGYAVDADTSVYARAYGGAGDDAIVARASPPSAARRRRHRRRRRAGSPDAAMIGGHIVFGGDGGDAITLAAVKDAKVFGGGGDNVIVATDSAGLQVSGGDGDDAIELARVDDSSVDGLDGDDVISLSGSYNQAYGGGVLYLGARRERPQRLRRRPRRRRVRRGRGRVRRRRRASCDSKKGRDSESWHRKDAPTKTCAWVEEADEAVPQEGRDRRAGLDGVRPRLRVVPSEGACVDDATWSHTNKKNRSRLRQRRAQPAARCGIDGARDARDTRRV
ncbi:hypothetical protein JL722_8392 [Aureococcus anophagefferens]|nr:hypothetical protein JL722_8392 [Aureococcus anophagefferens]